MKSITVMVFSSTVTQKILCTQLAVLKHEELGKWYIHYVVSFLAEMNVFQSSKKPQKDHQFMAYRSLRYKIYLKSTSQEYRVLCYRKTEKTIIVLEIR